MHPALQEDQENIAILIEHFYHYACTTIENFDRRPIGIMQKSHEKKSIDTMGIGFLKALDQFKDRYEASLSGSMGARYFGFVTGGATPASLIGDWLTSLYDQNVANMSESSSADITLETIQQLKALFDLDHSFEGIFVSGATMSNFVGLATAREWIGKRYGVAISKRGLKALPAPIKIYSATPHSSIYKSLSMLGLGQDSMTHIETEAQSEAISITDLKTKLEQQQGHPCIVVANAGTVNTVSFDNLIEIAKLKEQYTFWLHVDAAFGGFAKCSPQYKYLIEGLEHADSITIDAHKWLNVPYDSAMHFTKHLSLQFEVFKNTAPYLQPSFSKQNYVHLTPENSQRLRALPVWFSLLSYGKEGYREIVERNCLLAKSIADKIGASEMFELLSDTQLNGVLFTFQDKKPTQENIHAFVQALLKDGRIFITPTVYHAIPALRISISNWQTTPKDIETAWEALTEVYAALP